MTDTKMQIQNLKECQHDKYEKNNPQSILYSNFRKLNIKKIFLKEVREKKTHLTYRGAKIRISSYFSETMLAKREWMKSLKY